VARLKNLRALDLLQTNVSDAGLEHLKGLKQLRELNLWNDPKIKGPGLKHLAGLDSLERLNLGQTQIRDEDLQHLVGLKRLKFLDTSRTQVTDAGARALRQALPECEVKP
jgi:Leucine-rich repeat (LRR) protein